MPADGETLRIVAGGPAGSRRVALFLGESPVVTTSKDVVRSLALENGHPGDINEIRGRVRTEEPTWIKQRALHLLGYRERSHAELTRRLRDDGYDPEATQVVLRRLEELGFLDDTRFAATYVRTKVAAGWGRRRVADGLRSSGLDPDTIETTLAAEYPDNDRHRAASLIDARPITSREEAARAVARLVRRGFSYATARDVAFEALETDPDKPPHEHSS